MHAVYILDVGLVKEESASLFIGFFFGTSVKSAFWPGLVLVSTTATGTAMNYLITASGYGQGLARRIAIHDSNKTCTHSSRSLGLRVWNLMATGLLFPGVRSDFVSGNRTDGPREAYLVQVMNGTLVA